jgi:hypothetical protein
MNPTRLPLLLRLLTAQACAWFISAPLWAQSTTAATSSATDDAKNLARYDKNHNGKLDADELSALRADESKAARAVQTNTAANADGSEVIALSPFEVTSGNDRGYSASATLAGTRLNSSLEDIAGSVTVITKQQLLDTASVDINDIFQYEVGTEGTKQFTDLTSDGRGDYDNVAGNPTGANRIRGLSSANITSGGFAASGSIPIDTYNIEAVEIVRGPNSNLAGLSDAGGSVNLVQSRANLTRESTNFTARVDSYGGFRASLDLNRPIIANKLSARFSAVYEEKGFVRKPATDQTNRQQLALTFRPFRTTNITASWEHYHEWAQRANSVMPRESISYWRASGSPTYDPITQTFTINGVRGVPITSMGTNAAAVPAGLALLGSSNVRLAEYIDGGQIQLLMRAGNPSNNSTTPFQMTQSAGSGEARPLWKIPATTNKAIYDWTDINLAAPNYEINNANVVNVKLEQNLVRTQQHQLDLEVAWRREDQQNYRRMFVAQQDGVGNTIVVDTNEYLLNGQKNPFFLHPYLGGVNPQVYRRPNFTDQYRGQLAYQLDLRREKNFLKWLGYHRALAYEEYRMTIASPSSLRYHDSVVKSDTYLGPSPRTANLTNSPGLLTYPRFYLGGANADGVRYANPGPVNWTGQFNTQYPTANGVGPSVWTTEPVTIDEIYFAIGNQKKKVRTAGGSLQSFLWNDRVIPTIGRRRDRVYTSDNFGLTTNDGFFTDTSNLNNFGANKKWRAGDTNTKGVVVKPFRGWQAIDRWADQSTGFARFAAQTLRGLQFHYNESDSFQPADTAYNVFLEALPNPTGKTKEYGASLSMFDNRLYVRLTHFETTQFHSRSSIGVVATRAMSLDFDVPGQTRTFDLYSSAIGWQQQLHPEYTLDQAQAAAAKQIGYTVDYINSTSGKAISDVNDATSKGWELEAQVNPTRYWTLKVTGGKQIAVDSNVSLYIQELIDQRLPIWQTITDPQGNLWWTTRQGSDGIPRDYFIQNVQSPLNLAITTQGKRKPQTREYTLKGTTNYQLAGISNDIAWLRKMAIGGSFRWASKGAIGYYAAAPDADGIIRRLDANRPFYDKPVTNIDAWLSYTTRLFRDKIRTSFQLNVANLTESGHLQGIAVNPDGRYWNYRIIDPRQFVFTTRFDF